MCCTADVLTFPAAGEKVDLFPFLPAVISSHKCNHGRRKKSWKQGSQALLSFWHRLPFYSDEKQNGVTEKDKERRDRWVWQGRACDTSYLGNGPSPLLGCGPFFQLSWWPPPLLKHKQSLNWCHCWFNSNSVLRCLLEECACKVKFR